MAKNNYIRELTLTEEQAKTLFGITKEMIQPEDTIPNFGVPLPQWFIFELYNLLTINQYVIDTDLNSFSYYFGGATKASKNIKKITWTSTMDVLRTLLYDIYDPYIKARSIMQKDINEKVPLIFSSSKPPKLYNKSTKLTSRAGVLKDLIAPLCAKLTSSYKVSCFKRTVKKE